MILKNKIIRSWLALLVILAVISALIFFMTPPGKKHVLFWAVALLFAFAAVWYIPHYFRERWVKPGSLPAVYFLSGTVLIILGCVSSAFFSAEVGEQRQWGHIAEVIPLVLGAVIGGTYCCDAILGQDFDEESFQLGFLGALSGAIPIVTVLGMLCLPPFHPGIGISILFAAISPSIATVVMNKSRDNRPNLDVAFLVFLTGGFLILVAAVTAIWILPAVMDYQPRVAFFDNAQILSVVKNLVPSYCGAIGAGLITRGMERNVTPFSLKNWVIRHFDAFEFISATDDQVQFRLKQASNPDQIIVMTVDETVLQAMRSESRKRARYGEKMHKWLNNAARQKTHKKQQLLELHTPKAETLEGKTQS